MEHTLKAVDEELQALSADALEMGKLAVEQVRLAIKAFAARDAALGLQVARADERLDELEGRIERQAIRFIALRQPMADDLRRPITAMKTAHNLERCGDLAKNIGKRIGQMDDAPAAGQVEAIAQLGGLVADRLEAVMAAYARGDAAAAHEVWSKDEDIDLLHEQLYREILTCMTKGPDTVGVCAHLLFIAKNLERIGDHATNIAEMVHYQITGQDLAGRPKL
jgi:phosphate transport system protein